MSKRIIMLLSAPIFLFAFISCDTGNIITDIELNKFPDNIVYYVGESEVIDFKGGTVYVIAANGSIEERSISAETSLYEIVHTVDFTTTGLYEVKIVFQPPRGRDKKTIRIPVQVIKRG